MIKMKPILKTSGPGSTEKQETKNKELWPTNLETNWPFEFHESFVKTVSQHERRKCAVFILFTLTYLLSVYPMSEYFANRLSDGANIAERSSHPKNYPAEN